MPVRCWRPAAMEPDTMKKCPKCDCDLEPRDIGPVEVDECTKCGGIWFDKDELRRAKDAADEDLQWMDFEIWQHEDQFESKPSAHNCPVCDKAFVSLQYGDTGVQIDYCASCRGTWLDRGKFDAIVNHLEEELANRPFSDYVKESVGEAREIIAGPESLMSEWKDFATMLRMMQYRLFVEKPGLLAALTGIQSTVQ